MIKLKKIFQFCSASVFFTTALNFQAFSKEDLTSKESAEVELSKVEQSEPELEPVEFTQEDLLPLLQEDNSPEQVETAQENIPSENTIIPEPEHKEVFLSGTDHPLTKQFISQYLSNTGRQQLCRILYDSEPYRPYIKQELEKNGLPLILQYLPIVESNYKTKAVSRTGAVGLWQFMENSMYPFLKKNTWYDERYDPWKETDAAIKKLTDNYKMFKDWHLAITAYNMGAGALTRVMKKYPGKDFWYLAEHKLLPSQSIYYVPKLIAIADIIENAEYYGVLEIGAADKLIENAKVENFDYVNVAGMISLEQISKITGIERSVIDFLNPCLLKKCTPAGENYKIRLPEGTGPSCEEALKKADIATDALIYTVKAGDSLWAISRRYSLTVDDLCKVNGIKENDILRINQKLIIPVFK